MATIVTCGLFILALLLHWFSRYRTSGIFFFCSLILFMIIGCGPVPSFLLKHLQDPYGDIKNLTWSTENAIVLLGAGTIQIPSTRRVEPDIFSYGRIAKAAILYKACKDASVDCKIVVSGGDARSTAEPEAVTYSHELLALGVPDSDLILEKNSLNTWQNAQFTSSLLNQRKTKQILLVSSAIHLRRSLDYFSHFGINAIPVHADYLVVPYSIIPSSLNFVLTDVALHEFLGIARYHFYNWIGWNTSIKQVGSA